MKKLLTGYVVNFNRRHKRVGHLFQSRLELELETWEEVGLSAEARCYRAVPVAYI